MPTTLDLDLFAEESLMKPYDAYAQIRAAGPVVWLEPLQTWAVGRYEDVRGVLADWEQFTSEHGVGFNDQANAAIKDTLIASSPPLHDTFRSVLAESLSPRGLRKLQFDLVARAHDIIDPLVAKGSFDVVTDLARVFPPTVISDLVGLPADIRPQLLTWASAMMNMMGPAEQPRTFAGAHLVEDQYAWVSGVKGSDLAEGSWGRAIYDAADGGLIKPEHAPNLLWAYLAAAMDTTVNALGSAVWLFAEHPEEWKRLRADPSLIPNAFNEVLRFETPLQFLSRTATSDVDLHGAHIEAGQKIMVMYGSGNRDDRHFGSDADTFSVSRDASDHLAFGHGMHGCVGQGLARLEVNAVFSVLAESVERFEVTEPPVRRVNNVLRGLDSLVVSVE